MNTPLSPTLPRIAFIDSMRKRLSRGVELHPSFRHLEVILQTLGRKAAAVRFSVQATHEGLTYDNVIIADLLAVPIDVDSCAECVSAFLKHPLHHEVLFYCVANNVALRRSKLDETKLQTEMQESREIHLGVDSIARQLLAVADGLLAEIELDPDPAAMGDAVTQAQIRLELYRALCNFLLRHLFWRLKPGEKSKRLTRAKDRGSVVYLIPETLRRVDFSARFEYNDAASTKMDPVKQHVFRTPRDGVLHDVVNGYGYGARSDGLSTAVAIRLADLALLSGMLRDGCFISAGDPPAPQSDSFAPLVSCFLSLPDLLRLRSFMPPDGSLLALAPPTFVSAGGVGDVVTTAAAFFNAHKASLGVHSASPTTLHVPPSRLRPSGPFSATSAAVEGGAAVTIGLEVCSFDPLTVTELYGRLQAHLAEIAKDAATLYDRRSDSDSDGGHSEYSIGILDPLAGASLEEHYAAFGVARVPPWAQTPSKKLPSDPDGHAILGMMSNRLLAPPTTHELSSGSLSEFGPPVAGHPASNSSDLPGIHSPGFVLATPEDIICLSRNILSRARTGYVPLDLMHMTLSLQAEDLSATLSSLSVSPEDQADVFHALREIVTRLIEAASDGSADDRKRAEATAKAVGSEATAPDVRARRPPAGRGESQRLGVAAPPQQGSHPPSKCPPSSDLAGNRDSSGAFFPVPSLSQYPTFVSGSYEMETDGSAAGDLQTAALEEGDSVFDACEMWFAAARSVVILRRSVHKSTSSIVAAAALQFMLAVAPLFLNERTGEYPLRLLLETDDELAAVCREWAAEVETNERSVLSRCGKSPGLALRSSSLIRGVLASFFVLFPSLSFL